MHVTKIVFFLCIIVASNVLREFEKAFAGQIINPHNLLIKEKIGEGGYFTAVKMKVYVKGIPKSKYFVTENLQERKWIIL